MAKLSVWGVIALTAGFFLVSGIQSATAQRINSSRFVQTNSQGVLFYFEKGPNGELGGGQRTRQDTVYFSLTPGVLLKQHKTDGSLFHDEEFLGKVVPGDKVIVYRESRHSSPSVEIRRKRE